MKPSSFRVRPTVAAAIVLLAAPLHAQIAAGWAVAASFRAPASMSAPGTGGLWTMHPMIPGSATPITGLPGFVTGCQWPSAQYAGPDFVIALRDGRLVTNGSPWPLPATPTPMQIGVLTLSGSATVAVQTYSCGTIAPGSFLGIPQAVPLSAAGLLLIALDRIGIPGEALHGHTLATFDPNVPPGAPGVTNPAPVPLAGWVLPVGHRVNALCADPASATAWFATVDNAAGIGGNLYRVQLGVPAPGAQPVLVTTLPTLSIRSLMFEASSGSLIVGEWTGGFLYRCDGYTGALTPLPFGAAVNGVTIEPATGALLIASSYPGPEGVWRLDPGAAAPIALCSGPPAGFAGCPGFAPGWGALAALDVVPTHVILGPGIAGWNSNYDWNLTPAPGALPYGGNPAFSLSLVSTTGSTGGWLGVAVASLSPPLLVGAIPIYVDPAAVLLLLDLPATPTATFGPVGVPTGLAGVTISFQSLHFDGAASSGLAVTLL